jgi:NTE family protein
MLKFFKEYKYGLVLSGGAARGFAHVGVLKALHEKKIFPEIISGTSAGAIVGAFYADGFEPEEIMEIFDRKKLFDLFRATFPRNGFFRINGLQNLLKDNLRSKNIEDLKKKLIICATNIYEGKAEYFQKGNLVDAVIASASIPVLFEVKKIDKTAFIDGGIMDNLPVEPVTDSCRKLIGVHVNPLGKITQAKGIASVAERAFHLAVASSLDTKKALFDIYIEPPALKKYGILDLKKKDEIFQAGYKEALKVLVNK